MKGLLAEGRELLNEGWLHQTCWMLQFNLTKLNQSYGINLTSSEVEKFLCERTELRVVIRASEDVVVGRVGRELYEKFFRTRLYGRSFQRALAAKFK